MMHQTKTLLKRSAAVLGLMAVGGGAYMFSSSGTSFQANLITQEATALPVVETTPVLDTSLTVSSIFDATPTSEGASLSETGTTMSGFTMTGMVLTDISSAAVDTVTEEVRALEDLRPAAAEQATNFLNTLGFSNENQNTVEITSAATTMNANNNAPAENTNAATTALQSAPRVPQTGGETWILSLAILCAMMGMTMLLSEPKHG